tara:strand:- start:262 stop:2319 length:2058 start_codon:yes stop_codon:yes gene_type:complete
MAEQIKFGDNLYLKGEKLVLDNGPSNPGVIKSQNGTVQIEGNLTVTGTTTTVNSETVTLADNILLLNSNETGTPSEDGGIEIERGTSTNKLLSWNETTDKWTVGSETFVAGTFEGNLTGTSTGLHIGGLQTNGQDLISTGLSELNDVRIWLGSINDTTVGAITPASGTFTTITGDGSAITNVLANYTTTNLTEGTNKYFTDERVDDRIDSLFTNAYGISGTYNDAGDVYTLAFDPVNAGSAIAVLDTTDTTQAKFRTIREGQVGTGGNGDLTVTLSGDEIVIDTTNKLNELAYNTYTGIGSVSVYSLPYSVSQDWQALVYIDGVIQHPITNYTISGTTLTLTTPLPNASKMNVIKMATNSVASPITNANTLGGNLPAHFLDWAQFTGTPTTIAGYGITDATNVARQAIFVSGDLNYDSNSGEISTTFTLPANIVYDNSHQALHWSSALSISGNVITLTKGDSSTETVSVPAGYTDAMADVRAQLKIDALVDSAPGSLDTLNELAAALGDDANFSTTITNQIAAMSPTGNIIPSADNTYNLGSTSNKYANVYGHSIHAHYADLAERYATDVPYLKGTVVVFGGEAEITTTTEAKDVSVAGVISTNPALKMNADAGDSQTHPYVALRGRVPCNFIGPVSKGDLIVTADNEPGYAQSIGKNDAGRSVFAKSLETDLTEGKKLIEVVIL